MKMNREILDRIRRDHPIFFWGTAAVFALLIAGTLAMAVRVPEYNRQARMIDARMSETEREMRDRILNSRARRSELAVALLRRELTLRSMEEKGVHLALDTQQGTLSLRHGSATLRQIPVEAGGDSVVRAPDGRTWRFIQALGERHLEEKEVSPSYTVPEWVYISRGEPVPPESERTVEGALGRYVLRLNDGTEIYSRPTEGPFVEHVKPGAYVASEEDLRAIYDAIRTEIAVYIY